MADVSSAGVLVFVQASRCAARRRNAVCGNTRCGFHPLAPFPYRVSRDSTPDI